MELVFFSLKCALAMVAALLVGCARAEGFVVPKLGVINHLDEDPGRQALEAHGAAMPGRNLFSAEPLASPDAIRRP